jgi:hypothetical protein
MAAAGTTGGGRDWSAVRPKEMEHAMNNMNRLKTLGAVAALALTLPLATASPSVARGRGPGPCTPPGNSAVGAAGPAMSGGQLMAGVGQCRRIGEWDHHAYNRYPDRGYRHYGYYNGYRPYGWDGGPVGWALGTAAGVTGAVTGLAVGSPYYYGGYGYGPDYYSGYPNY